MTNTKKILIITHGFIPYSANLGSVLRMLKLADFLVDKGYEIHLLAAKGFFLGYLGYEHILDKIKITYVHDLFQYASTLTSISGSAHKEQSAAPSHRYLLLPGIMKEFIKEVSVPDPIVYSTPFYAVKALKIIRQHGIKNVIVSSPPHSMQLVGLIVKTALKNMINLVVDYRDTWNTTQIFRKKNFAFQALNSYLEKCVLTAADRFVYCTNPMLGKINHLFFDISEKSQLVMNGFDIQNRIVPKRINMHNAFLTIGYFGALNEHEKSYRNPSLFFKAVEKLKTRIKLIFYGNISIASHWNERLKGIIEIHKSIPHNKAIERMQDMDLLMLLHSERYGADEVITGKFFDYILSERPILSVGPTNMESSRMVREHGIGYVADLYNEMDLLNTLNQIVKDWGNKALPTVRNEDFKYFSRQSQFNKLLNMFV